MALFPSIDYDRIADLYDDYVRVGAGTQVEQCADASITQNGRAADQERRAQKRLFASHVGSSFRKLNCVE
jgi:hypothetical protein